MGISVSRAGFPLRFGVRGDKPVAALAECGAGADAAALPVAEAAAWADVVFLAVPASAAVDVARSLAGALAGKVVVDCNNPLTWNEGPVWSPPAEGSLAAAIAEAAPGARVVKGFNTFGAEFHRAPGRAGAPVTVFLAGDDGDAVATVSDIARQSGFEPVAAGPLRNAAVLENLAMLWIHMATVGGWGRDFAFSISRVG